MANTTTQPLSAGQVFLGDWQNTGGMAAVVVSVKTDQPGTCVIEFSLDYVNVDFATSFKVEAGISESHRRTVRNRYFRVKFTNTSAVNQTYLRLESILGQYTQLTSQINESIQSDSDTVLNRIIDTELTIASGYLEGYGILNKVGYNPDIDSATCPEDMWAGGGPYTGFPSAAEQVQVFSSSALDTALGTGARTVTVLGLDSNYNSITEDLTMNGLTPALSTKSFLRTIGVSVATSGSAIYNQGIITVRQAVTQTNIFAVCLPGHNQSQTAAYTVPAGKTAYLRRIVGGLSAAANTTAECALWVRAFGQVPRLRKIFQINSYAPLSEVIYGGTKLTEKTDIAFRVIGISNNNGICYGGFDIILIDN